MGVSPDRFELGGEVPQKRSLIYDTESPRLLTPFENPCECLCDIIDMRLGVDSPGHCQSDQFSVGWDFVTFNIPAKHDRTDFDGSDATPFIQFTDELLGWKLRGRYVRVKPFGIYINCMATRGLNELDSYRRDSIEEISNSRHAIFEILLVENFV